MKSRWIIEILGFFSFAMAAPLAHAQQTKPVDLKSEVKLEKTVTENGSQKKVLLEPKVVVPGDRLLFTTTYRNPNATPVDNFVLTNPIQPGVMLSDEGSDMLDVSVDAGKAWGKLTALTVPDGNGGQRPALASDVTHVRWVLALISPGANGVLNFHAIVR